MKQKIMEFIKKLRLTKTVKSELIASFKYAGFYLVALLYWEILLRSQIGFEDMTFYFLLFLPAQAMFLALLTGWFKEKINRIITPIVMLLPCAFYMCQMIYFRIFGSLFSISMMGMGADAVENFGWALWSTVKDSVLWIILCIIPVIAAVVFSFMAPLSEFKKYRPLLHLAGLARTVVLWFLAVLMLLPFGTGDNSPYTAYSSSYIDTDTASNRLGVLTNSVVELSYKLFGAKTDETEETLVIPQPFEEPEPDSSPNILSGIDFNALKNLTDDEGKKQLCDYFAAVSGTNKNAYTGTLKDYNLIYICAESFSSYAIDPVVTPTLYKLSTGGFVLNNYYNSYKNTTTNGEYSFMTGLWPDVSRVANQGTAVGSFAQSSDNFLPFALGNMFEKAGVSTYAYHNYRGEYYRRSTTHPNLGYTTTRFMGGENGMKFTTAWPSSDYEMMQQSVDDYINKDQFHAYYMTFSGHGPYSYENPICVRNIEEVRKLTKGRNLSEGARHYLAAHLELEKAMAYLVQRLEEAGKLDKTLIVLTSDHYPYYLIDSSYNSLAGKKVEPNFGKFESTCIMYCSSVDTVQIDTYCCNVDIVPTILNLFGFEYDSRLLPGTDIFSGGTHMAMLYNKSFVTNKVKYNAQSGKAEWMPGTEGMSADEKQAFLDYCIALTKARYTASLEVMDEDFFKFVFDNSNLK